jgi:hypothetical protein
MKKVIMVVLGIALFLGVAVFLFMQEEKINELSVEERVTELAPKGEEFPDQGREHIVPGQAHEPYNSNPPTSGPHLTNPADWGIHDAPLSDEQVVHNLEHGGIWITYKDIDEQTKASLETVAKANPGSVIMSPRPSNDDKIAVVAWTRLIRMDHYDEAAILEFIRANKNKAPEPLAN